MGTALYLTLHVRTLMKGRGGGEEVAVSQGVGLLVALVQG